MAQSFSASLRNAAIMRKADLEYIARSAITEVITGAQETQIGFGQGATSFVEGKIPVDTSELANSLTVDGASAPGSFSLNIAGLEIGDVMRFAWTAPQARPMEFGFTTESGGNVPGRYFVTRNAEQFSDHVDHFARRVRG